MLRSESASRVYTGTGRKAEASQWDASGAMSQASAPESKAITDVLNDDAITDVLLCVALDPEPLLTLRARAKTLAAVAQASRAFRNIVRERVWPAMMRMHVEASAIEAHAVRAPPTLESLALARDGELVAMSRDLLLLPGSLWITSSTFRAHHVRELLDAARWKWDFVPLIHEVRRRSGALMRRSVALSRFRLKGSDLSGLRQQHGYVCTQDVSDVALRVHGSKAAIDRVRDAEAALRLARRSARDARAQGRIDRRSEVKTAALAAVEAVGGGPDDWSSLIFLHMDVEAAVSAYEVTTSLPTGAKHRQLRDRAVALAAERLKGVCTRRNLLPWPPRDVRGLLSRETLDAYEDVVWFDSDNAESRALVEAASRRWTLIQQTLLPPEVWSPRQKAFCGRLFGAPLGDGPVTLKLERRLLSDFVGR